MPRQPSLTLQVLRQNRLWISRFLAGLMALWQIGQPLQGAVSSWTGAVDQNWNVGGNWSSTLAPNATDDLIFGSMTPGTITMGASSLANSLSFFNSYRLNSNDLTLTTNAIRVSTDSDVTISSQLTSITGLALTGGGVLRLANNANSIAGPTTLTSGTLVISNVGQLGGASTAISINANNAFASSTSTAGFAGGTLVLDGNAAALNLTRPVNIEGLGANGRGAALVSIGNNTLAGLVTTPVTATARASRITSVNGITVLSGGLSAGGTVAATFTSLGGNNSAGSGSFNLTGPLTGTGSIERLGSGTLVLNPSVATGFTGTVRIGSSSTVNQSSVRISTATAFGAGTGTGANSVIDMNGGVLEARSDGNLNVGKTMYQRANSTIFTGPAAGGSGVNGTTTFSVLHVASNSTMTFNNRNGYGVTFTGASTQENSNNNVAWANNMGGTLLFNSSVWPNTDTTVVRTLTFSGNGNTTVTGSIAATGTAAFPKTVAKTGSGLLTLIGNAAGTGVNGPTTVQGSLAITDFRSISDANTSIQDITLGNATTTPGNLIIGTTGTSVLANLVSSRPIAFAGTTNNNAIYANQTLASPVVLNGAITKPNATTANIVLGGTSLQENIINSAIPATGSGGLIKNGLGLWALSATNLYAGPTTITRGTLRLKALAGASDIIPAAGTNTVVFGSDTVTQDAGGTLELLGATGVATTEALGALTPTVGAGTIKLTGSGAAANLIFSSLGAVGKGSGVNFDVASSVGGTVTLTGALTTTATTLPGNGHLYINGTDFARSDLGVIVTPVYGTDAGFINAAAGTATLTAASHNQVTGVINAQTPISITSLKTSTFNMDLAGLLTVNTGGAANDGGILAVGSSTISGVGGITTGGAGTLVIRANLLANILTLNTPINASTAGGLTKNGAGILIIGAANAQTGATTINEGTIRLGPLGVLSANSTTSDLAIRQGATLDLNGVGTGTAIRSLDGSGAVVNGMTGATPAAALLQVGNSNGTGTFTGIIGNGTGGALSVTKLGTGGMSWLGNNTYTGVTTIGSTGLVTVNTLGNGGTASGIGQSTNAAANLVFNGSTGGLVYAGGLLNGSLAVGSRSATTDRLFTLSGTGATLSSTATNNNAIVFSNTGAIVHSIVGPQALIFTGTSTGDNTFNPQLTDSGTGANITSVTKSAAGQWNFGNSSNSYSGLTSINEGVLGFNTSGALSPNSPIVLGSAALIGQLQMSGTLARNLAVPATPGTGTITFAGSAGGGFAAMSDKLTVTLNGGSAVTWASGGFVPNAATLSLNSATSLGEVEFTNAVDLAAGVRTITVNDNGNTGADFATLSGALSNGSVIKAGVGMLQLTGASTYVGSTAVNAGGLTVRSLGNSASPAATATSVGLSGIGTAFTDTNAVNLGTGGTGGVLQYTGTGETSDRRIRITSTTGNPQIHADGSGALILTNVINATAGAKGLFLRGSSTAGNRIDSQLVDNGGILSLTVDGGATWILTNSNTYTGNTAASGGALGIGNNTALGTTGVLTNNNGVVFAYGTDRSITNGLALSNNASNSWIGDYSLTVNGATNLAASANNVTTVNNIVAGKALTLNNGVTANALTANRAWVLDGAGETIINGNFTTSTAFGVRFDVNGGGTLTLGTNGATSNFNQSITAVDVDRGTLKFTTNNAIPTAAALSGGVTLTPEGATVDTARIDLNGTTQTFNAFTAITDGISIIDNSNAGAATMIVGANNTAATFGTGGIGTYSITQTGGGAINLTKIGTNTANFAGALGNTGIVTSNGGILNINSTTAATGAIGDGGAVNFKGGITTPGNLTAVTTNNGGLVSFASSSGTPFNNLGTLNLSLTANSGLELDVGDSGTDKLTSVLASVANVTTLFIKDTDITGGTTYDLIANAGGGLGVLGNYLLNLPGYSGSTLTVTPTLVQLNAGTLITSDLFWNNGTGLGGGTLTSAWNTVDSVTTNINFSGLVGGTPSLQLNESLPGKGQKVIFQGDNISGGAALVTTLEQAFTVNSLEFRQSTVAADTSSTISIAPGAVVTNSLTIKPSLATNGINLLTGSSGTVSISAPIVAGTAQTWTVADAPIELTAGVTTLTTPTIVDVASTTGLRPGMAITGTGIPAGATIISVNSATQVSISIAATAAGTGLNILAAHQLNISGAVSGAGNVVKAGAGKAVLSGANGTLAGTFTNSAGITQVSTLSALGGVVNTPGSGTDIVVTGGSFFYNSGTAGTFVNDIALNGGALSAGGNNQTYSGNINVLGNSFINLRDQAAATVAFGVARNVTLSGVVSNSGSLTIDGVGTISGGNQLSGTLVMNNALNTWSGALILNRGTAQITSVASPNFTANNVNFNSFGRLQVNGTDSTTLNRIGTLGFAAGALGEFTVDNAATTPTGNYTVNQQGAMTLGSSGTGATARLFLADTGSTMNITGGVTLGGNSSISVSGGDADSLVTISGTGISDGGSGYSLAVNDEAGGWGVTSTRLAINAASTYSGGTTLNEGTLLLGHKDALGTGVLTITGVSTITPTTDLSTVVPNSLTLNANLTVSGAQNLTFGGTTTNNLGDRTLTNSLTAGALRLSSVNLAEAAIARTLTIAGAGATVIGTLTNNGANNTLINTGSGTPLIIDTNVFLSESAGTGRSLTIRGASNTTISGVVADFNGAGLAGNLIKSDAGTLTLSNANIYTGTTSVNGGMLLLNNATALPGGIAITGGTSGLTLNGGVVGLGNGPFSRNLGNGADQLQFTASGGFAAVGANRVVNIGGAATGVIWNTGSFVPTGSSLILSHVSADSTVDFQNPIALDAATRTIQVDNGSAAVDAIISGAVTGAAGSSLIKAGAGTLALSGLSATAANNYTGTTFIDGGTLALTTTSPSFTGGLTFGSTSGSATFGNLDLSAANATFAGLTVQSNSTTANTATIGVGRTLTINGNVLLSTVANGNAALTMTGGGALVVNASAGTFHLSNIAGTNTATKSAMDLSGLNSVSISLGATGSLVVGQQGDNNANGSASLKLANTGVSPTNSITAGTVTVGGSSANPQQLLELGNGTNTINANTFNIGTGNRDAGLVQYQGGGSGSFTLNGFTGAGSRANVNMGTGGATTGATAANLLNLNGQAATLNIGTLVMGNQFRNGAATNTLNFNQGTFDATTVQVGRLPVNATNTVSVTHTSSLNLGGGTITIGTGALEIGNSVATNITNPKTVSANVNISGGTVDIANSVALGAAVRLGSNTGAANVNNVNALLNITGGTVTLSGDMVRGTVTGTGTNQARLQLDGASAVLDMTGKNITNLTSIIYTNGLLKNLGVINTGVTLAGIGSRVFDQGALFLLGDIQGAITGTGLGLTKQGAGILTLSGANIYDGVTTISGGVLALNNTNALPGGIAATGGTSGLTVNGGVLGFGLSDFNRALGTGADQVQFTGSGGFSAFGTDRSVNLGGAGAGVTWNTGSFVPTGSNLILSNANSTNTVTFVNPIDFTTDTRSIRVENGSAAADAVLTGVLSGTGGLNKSGSGMLVLSGLVSNAYTGVTNVSDGTLQVGVSGVGTTGTGLITAVKTGATYANAPVISGSGTLQGAVVIGDTVTAGNRGILAPGDGNTTTSNATLTITAAGGLTIAAGSQTQLGITAASGTDSTFAASGMTASAYLASLGSTSDASLTTPAAWANQATSSQADFINISNGTGALVLGTNGGGAAAGQGIISIFSNGLNTGTLAAGQIFNLVDWFGAFSGGFNVGSGATTGGIYGDFDLPDISMTTFNWDTSAFASHGVIAVVNVIPEPSRALLMLIGLLALCVRRRRIQD